MSERDDRRRSQLCRRRFLQGARGVLKQKEVIAVKKLLVAAILASSMPGLACRGYVGDVGTESTEVGSAFHQGGQQS